MLRSWGVIAARLAADVLFTAYASDSYVAGAIGARLCVESNVFSMDKLGRLWYVTANCSVEAQLARHP